MKPSRFLLLAALPIGVGTLWLVHLRAEGAALSAKVEEQRTASQKAAEARRVKMQTEAEERNALKQRIAEFKSQLAAEQKTATELAAQKTEIESKLPPMDKDDIVISFGRIRDMAAEMGEVARLGSKLFNPGTGKITPEENQLLMATVVKVMAWMPEIAAFEDTPAEISCLHAGTIAEVFALNAETTARVEKVISDHFVQMKTAGLTASSRDRAGWRDQRSASVEQLMWKLRPLLPADSDGARTLPMILNLGAGIEKHVNLKVDAKGESSGSVSMSMPTWPPVPWLPKK